MNIEKYQAIFFDFDGVVADSVDVKTMAFAKLYESYGQEVVNKIVKHHYEHGGMSRFDKFRYYASEFLGKKSTQEELDTFCERFSRLVVDKVVAAPEIPGAEAFLKKWHKKMLCFIVSGTPEEEIRLIVEKRGGKKYFKEIKGSPVSKTDNCKYLLDKYDLLSSRCLFIGDAESDYEATKVCGLDFAGIAHQYNAFLFQKYPDITSYRNFYELCPID